ncbi:hypothetical protein THAOC_14253, partial [Thalassiosira oceanica]
DREVKAEEDGWSLFKAGLAVEDPFELFYDVAHVVKVADFHHIRREMALAYSKIVAAAEAGGEGGGRALIDAICEPVAAGGSEGENRSPKISVSSSARDLQGEGQPRGLPPLPPVLLCAAPSTFRSSVGSLARPSVGSLARPARVEAPQGKNCAGSAPRLPSPVGSSGLGLRLHNFWMFYSLRRAEAPVRTPFEPRSNSWLSHSLMSHRRATVLGRGSLNQLLAASRGRLLVLFPSVPSDRRATVLG